MFVIYWLGYNTHDIVVNKGDADYLEALTMVTGQSGVTESLWIVPGRSED